MISTNLKLIEVVVASKLVIAKISFEHHAIDADLAVLMVEELLFDRYQREVLVWVVNS
jgi:hypothetical protein